MSPLQIEIILHYYARCDDYRDGDFSAPAVADAMVRFIREDVLAPCEASRHGATYQLMPRGRAYVEAILAMPLPVCKWVMPEEPE